MMAVTGPSDPVEVAKTFLGGLLGLPDDPLLEAYLAAFILPDVLPTWDFAEAARLVRQNELDTVWRPADYYVGERGTAAHVGLMRSTETGRAPYRIQLVWSDEADSWLVTGIASV